MNDSVAIMLATIIIVVIQILYQIIRDILRHRNGPSQKEFGRAVGIIAAFIEHHNKWHPKAKISSIAIEESTNLDVRWSVTTKAHQ